MTLEQKQPIFTVSNLHVRGPHQPPSINGDEPQTRHSYFQNRDGDQSLFVFHKDTGEAVLYMGDAGWTAYPIAKDGTVKVTLSQDEQLWLIACMQAVSDFK